MIPQEVSPDHKIHLPRTKERKKRSGPDLADFYFFFFRFSRLKTAVFGFGVLCGFSPV